MTPHPTGRVVRDDDGLTLVITREYAASAADVWAAVTEPERMQRWIGTWSGDPASGHVTFAMTAEGDDVAPEEVEVRECDPPRRFAVTTRQGEGAWHFEVDVEEGGEELGGLTTLTFRQTRLDADGVVSFGPGWEYYHDRLGVALADGDVSSVDFGRDYEPAMVPYYRAQLD